MAHVHVVILGLTRREDEPRVKRLFAYADGQGDPTESVHAKLSPYLIDAATLADPHLVVREVSQPINGLPKLIIGSKPIDGGHLIFTPEEREAFLKIGAGGRAVSAPLHRLRGTHQRLGSLHPRLAGRHARRTAPPAACLGTAGPGASVSGGQHQPPHPRPGRDARRGIHVTVLPDRPFLAIPEVSSERREYAPIAYLEPPTVPSNQIRLTAGCLALAVWTAHVPDAHGVAANRRRQIEKRLPLLHRHRLQHVPAAPADRRRQDAPLRPGADDPRCPRRLPRLVAWPTCTTA